MFSLIDSDADVCTDFTPTTVRDISDARRLGRAFVAASRGGFTNAFDELHAAVDAFVVPRRIAGVPPERVVVAVKDALALYGGLQALTAPAAAESAGERGEVYDRLFRWTVNAYYSKR